MEKKEFVLHLEKSLVSEIFKAEESYFLFNQISQNAHSINTAHRGQYKELFGHLQEVLQRDVIVVLSKIYDKPSKKYPTLCFGSVFNEMRESADDFPIVSENRYFREQLIEAGMPEQKAIELTSGKNAPGFVVKEVVDFFSGVLQSDEFSEKINSLKTLRDKRVAHNEVIGLIQTSPTWGDILNLIEVAKKFVGVVGWIFNTVYRVNGEYLLTNDSMRTSISLKTLFRELGIIEREANHRV